MYLIQNMKIIKFFLIKWYFMQEYQILRIIIQLLEIIVKMKLNIKKIWNMKD